MAEPTLAGSQPGPLSGLRVFDWTIYALGPFAGVLLGALGAEVIKVEAPGGDPQALERGKQRGLAQMYMNLNLGKRSIILDLAQARDRERALALLAECDVFLNNMRPGTPDRLGLGYEAVRAVNPGIVYAVATAWGHRGPMAGVGGVDVLAQAFAGWASITGPPGGRPELARHLGYLDLTASFYTVAAILQALLVRERTGSGQRIDVSLLGSTLAAQTTRLAEHFATGQVPRPTGSASTVAAPDQAFRCQDGRYLAVSVLTDAQWRGLRAALGDPSALADPGFETNAGRVARREALAELLGDCFAARPSAWWDLQLGRHSVPHGRFWDFEVLRHHPQVRDNGFLVEVETARWGRLFAGGPPWRFEATPAVLTSNPEPGEHTDEVLAALAGSAPGSATFQPVPAGPGSAGFQPVPAGPGSAGFQPVPAGRDRQAGFDRLSLHQDPGTGWKPALPGAPPGALPGTSLDLPLAGLRVLELTQGIAGPYAGQLLAEGGAEVLKLEPPGGDYIRRLGPALADGSGALFATLNHGKRVKRLDGADLLRLACEADVVLVDSAGRDGPPPPLRCEQVHEVNPRAVYCAVSPFGEAGPLAAEPGSELVVQAMSDVWGGLGEIGQPPLRLGADMLSLNTGVAAFQGILAALFWRNRSGRGQRVDVSLLGTAFCLKSYHWGALSDPDDWEGIVHQSWTNPPNHGYRTADGAVYFAFYRSTDQEFFQLLLELGMPDEVLSDPRFGEGPWAVSGVGRYAAELRPVWEAAFSTRTTAEVLELLARYKVDAVPINDVAAVVAHPQVAALGILGELETPGGRLRYVRPPWQVS